MTKPEVLGYEDLLNEERFVKTAQLISGTAMQFSYGTHSDVQSPRYLRLV